MMSTGCLWLLHCVWLMALGRAETGALDQLVGTDPLEFQGDIAAAMVDGIDRFLLKQTLQVKLQRDSLWHPDYSSPAAYAASLEFKRQRLARMLGVRDSRVPFDSLTLIATIDQPALVGETDAFKIFAIRWPVVRDVSSEGLLLLPNHRPARGTVIFLTDADQTPQKVCTNSTITTAQSPLDYVQAGYRVIVPRLISRRMVQRDGRAKLTQREFLYRCSYELGRHVLGYEIQKVLACVDWADRQSADDQPILIDGQGEGGLIALLSAAIDTRIDSTIVRGAFGSRQNSWQEGIDRNIFGLLAEFGDAEIAAMVAPRTLKIDWQCYPDIEFSGADGGAPGSLSEKQVDRSEFDRALELTKPLKIPGYWLSVAEAPDKHATAMDAPRWNFDIDVDAQEDRLVYEIEQDTQWLLAESPQVRAEFIKALDTSSPQSFDQSIEAYRKIFREEVIGEFDIPLNDPKPKTRKIYDEPGFIGYEVMLDVWDDVFAYGVLLLPKNLKSDERRPVVVCQHGLEGRPMDTIVGDHPAYHDFAAKLCERGFIVFAPQNPYIGGDRFRTLQRKANPLGKTLFSVIVPQHQQIVNWLKSLPCVDAERIAFYGLSYGGKSAMRIPPLVTDYCLSICSADFNEWVVKNASTRLPFSYVWTGEYEIFEWDLGSRFNYSEMATLIAPRPFMVERGHTDGVSSDEWVAFEFAKVFHLYSHRLKMPDRCEMEVFDGPHTIHGQGTFKFLHHHLRWPEP